MADQFPYSLIRHINMETPMLQDHQGHISRHITGVLITQECGHQHEAVPQPGSSLATWTEIRIPKLQRCPECTQIALAAVRAAVDSRREE